jgi:hypothetical protein
MRGLLLVVIGLALGLGLAEGAARVYLELLPSPADAVYLPDSLCGYRLRPGAGTGPDDPVNSFGFHDREHPRKKPTGVKRLIGIGDSFLYGEVSPEKNFLRVAETELNSRSKQEIARASVGGTPANDGRSATPEQSRRSRGDSARVEVILMGLGGYTPDNYLGVLRGYARSLDPDLVLLSFYVGNDVTGIPAFGRVLHGELYTMGSYNPWLDLLRKSRFYDLIERHLFFRLRAARLRAASGQEADRPQAAPSRFYLQVEGNRLPVYARNPEPRCEQLWLRAEAALADFDDACRAARIPWVLMVVPDEIQVDSDLRAEILRRLSKRADLYAFEEPQRRLRAFAARRRVPVLDLLPSFRVAQDSVGPLYLANDTHWNQRGNEVAGRAIAEFTAAMLFPPPRHGGHHRDQPPGEPSLEPGGRVPGTKPREAPVPHL